MPEDTFFILLIVRFVDLSDEPASRVFYSQTRVLSGGPQARADNIRAFFPSGFHAMKVSIAKALTKLSGEVSTTTVCSEQHAGCPYSLFFT